MMRQCSRVVGLLLGFGVLADAHAATFTLEPDVVMVGGSITFSFTSELGDWPGGTEGAEQPQVIHFNGPCTNSRDVSAFNQYGYGADIPFPAPGWTNYLIQCSTVSKPGNYIATLGYRRLDAAGLATTYFIDLPFTVLAELELNAIPGFIAAGETTRIGANGMSSVDPATSLQVECPDGTVDHAIDVSPIDDGFSIIWPGPYFGGACDSSQPGGYAVTFTTERRSAMTRFGVFGDRDGDGWLDGYDNCVNDPNPGQEDVDGDQRGDVCDTDNDDDAISDENDNCPGVANTSQDDLDADGLGDVCDPDIEEDGVLNAADNCEYHYNPGQENVDADPFGDACDPDPEDSDNDGTSDLVDNCPSTFNPAQQDDDGDGVGTACDPDIDGDGIWNDDEAAAGTHPNDPQSLEAGINPFGENGAIGSGVSVPDGEPVGVVINPATDVDSIDITVVDPWGGAYSQQTLIPQSPVAFYFVPVWPGTWTIDADLHNGEVLSASIDVIPEPAAAFGALAAAATLLALAAVRRAPPSLGRLQPVAVQGGR